MKLKMKVVQHIKYINHKPVNGIISRVSSLLFLNLPSRDDHYRKNFGDLVTTTLKLFNKFNTKVFRVSA